MTQLITINTSKEINPLDPLSKEEVSKAVSLVSQNLEDNTSYRFVSVELLEPPKEKILSFTPTIEIDRIAKIILLNNKTTQTEEWKISLSQEIVLDRLILSGVQPNILLDEFSECEEAVKASSEFQKAVALRGVTNMDLVMVDAWSAGNFGTAEEKNTRLVRALSWVRSDPDDNGYARPLEGLIAVVDLNTMQVLRVEDYGVIPLPKDSGNYGADQIETELRNDLKPLQVIQPEGPSFEVNGWEVSWQKWKFRIGFTSREGLVLHTLTYDDQGQERPILYRASLSEMVVPYGDPGPNHNRQNAFDAGEYGIGMLANSLELGCDCLGVIRYFDVNLITSRGNVATIKNAICLHEEDFGTLWKHTDWRTNKAEVRRSRRLVISSISTVANYEYGFFWYLYLDGTIEFQVKLTGIVNTAAIKAGDRPKYASLLKEDLAAPIHQHFFNLRLDMQVDGMKNTVTEVHTEAEPPGETNPLGNGFFAKTTVLKTELEAQQLIDPFSARYWKIINPSVKNAVGDPVSYKLMPMENAIPFADKESSLIKRAGFITKHLWVTPYSPTEMYAAGDYPNQNLGGDGLPKWTSSNRNIENEDLVVWYTMGHHHVVRPEDWPVMPAAYIGFMLKPSGFFSQNPSLDVPPTSPLHGSCKA